MRLYTIPGAPNSRKAEAVVAHLGLEDVELVALDVRAGEHKQPDYLKIHPLGLVPALQEGDWVLWESHAIMCFLADRTEASSLYPEDLRARAEVHRWMSWSQTHWARAVGVFFNERFRKPVLAGVEGDEALVAAALPEFQQAASILENHLQAGQGFLVGASVTLADFALASTEGFWERIALPVEAYPALLAWRDRLNGVPGWRETLPEFLQPRD